MTECKHSNTKNGELVNLTSYEFCLDCGMSRSVWEQGEGDWQDNMFALKQEYRELKAKSEIYEDDNAELTVCYKEMTNSIKCLKQEAVEANDIIVNQKAESQELGDMVKAYKVEIERLTKAYKHAIDGFEQIKTSFKRCAAMVDFSKSIEEIDKHIAECEELLTN